MCAPVMAKAAAGTRIFLANDSSVRMERLEEWATRAVWTGVMKVSGVNVALGAAAGMMASSEEKAALSTAAAAMKPVMEVAIEVTTRPAAKEAETTQGMATEETEK